MAKAAPPRTYLPAAGRDWALPLYDPLTTVLGVGRIRKALLEGARVEPLHRVLDVGCGTGTLAVLLKGLSPQTDVVGVDPDPRALERGRLKAKRAGVSVQFDVGFADELPYPDESFDRVLSSLMFHHLPRGDKEKMLREVGRVLKPGGLFAMVDFADPHVGLHGRLSRLFHSRRVLEDNAEDRVLTLMTRAGFTDAARVGVQGLVVGRVAYYHASKRR